VSVHVQVLLQSTAKRLAGKALLHARKSKYSDTIRVVNAFCGTAAVGRRTKSSLNPARQSSCASSLYRHTPGEHVQVSRHVDVAPPDEQTMTEPQRVQRAAVKLGHRLVGEQEAAQERFLISQRRAIPSQHVIAITAVM
jgi:hypothetical protein